MTPEHTCRRVGQRPTDGDGKCATCTACSTTRRTHRVITSKAVELYVARCTHCDGPEANDTIKKTVA